VHHLDGAFGAEHLRIKGIIDLRKNGVLQADLDFLSALGAAGEGVLLRDGVADDFTVLQFCFGVDHGLTSALWIDGKSVLTSYRTGKDGNRTSS
jgi:hypothetical protein